MLTQIGLALILLLVSESHGFFMNRISQPSMCRLPTKPCRMKFTVHHLNGTFVTDMESHSCTCSGSRPCNDWSRSSHVVSRNLLSSTYNITLNMMFCNSVTPLAVCSVGDDALVLSGYQSLPTEIYSYNCRCNDAAPLLLKRRLFGTNYLYYHTYVCNSHLEYCAGNANHCAIYNHDNEVEYVCKCNSGKFCRSLADERETPTHAYCNP